MRPSALCLLLFAASACAGAHAQAPAEPPPDPASAEVQAIAAAARDANAALAVDAPRWDVARQQIPTPLDRAYLERRLGEHARSHGLELSQFRLAPPDAKPIELPARVHPAAPYPLRAEDALLEPKVRFALTPLVPARVEAFVRTLPEVTPLVIVQAIERGMDFAQIEATAPTFRQLDPAPRYALEMPADRAGDDRLAADVAAANEQLAALSDARLRHERMRAYEAARARAEANAAAIELPPPARPGAPAPRTAAP